MAMLTYFDIVRSGDFSCSPRTMGIASQLKLLLYVLLSGISTAGLMNNNVGRTLTKIPRTTPTA